MAIGSMTNESGAPEPRSVPEAMIRGAARRCPACGNGALFDVYLAVNPTCPSCGEALHHHRADDLPAFLGVLLGGKIMIGLLVWSEQNAPLGDAAIWVWPVVAALLVAALISPIKGAVIGLQWALRLHGFEGPEGRGTISGTGIDDPAEP